MKRVSHPCSFGVAPLGVFLLCGALLGACGGDGGGGILPEVDCEAITVPTYGELDIIAVCTGCHSSTLSGGARLGAPVDVNYDTYDAAASSGLDGAEEVFRGRMPPGGGIADAEKEAFNQWVQCGMPE
jgi:hypothetical protein